MEFYEKLQELRKSKSLTQEELAEALYVSRTAISKWESGRGYPNIDSLKEIARFFSVTVDDLICSEEIISVAKREKEELKGKILALAFATLDIAMALLLFLPIFGNGNGTPTSVALYGLTGIHAWIRNIFTVVICITILTGIIGFVACNLEKKAWSRRLIVVSIALSILGASLFIITRQPYAGIILLGMLIVKGLALIAGKY
ncbi:MAG: helix-turn-helix transcriptional regulator [Lachnospiraceae bacterium]|nr:helix-turn-helix transcriptional regulator [Lachnospiraceae bacterium]MBR5993385.1 helix-turn-helix transcriptional regulator [Lachnospiraceae bacterium]